MFVVVVLEQEWLYVKKKLTPAMSGIVGITDLGQHGYFSSRLAVAYTYHASLPPSPVGRVAECLTAVGLSNHAKPYKFNVETFRS